MITFRQKGDLSKTTKFLKNTLNFRKKIDLDKYGRLGVAALSSATPKDTGLTSRSWYYEIVTNDNTTSIVFCNSNINNYVPIAIILQYGHATRNGGWVEGIDYINPALKPIFDDIAKDAWEEVITYE